MYSKKDSGASFENIILITYKIIFALLTTVTLFFWLVGISIVLNAVSHGGQTPTWYLYFYPFPILYFLFCYLSCTRWLRGRALLISGLLMNLGLIAWAFVGRGMINAIICVAFILLWTALYLLRINLENDFQHA